MYKIRPLEWQMNEDGNYCRAAALGVHQGLMTLLCFEEDLWWPNWDQNIPGSADLAALQALGQEYHDKKVLEYLILD